MGELKQKIRHLFYTLFKKPFIVIHNYFFCKRYPFYIYHDINGKVISYNTTYYDCLSKGWKKAFGKKLSRDLKKAIKTDKCEKNFSFYDIKEKYGTLRIDACGYGKMTDTTLSYYEELSTCYCIYCGKPARYCTLGWITYVCEKCYDKFYSSRLKDRCRLTEENIPVITKYIDGHEYELDYGIDYKKLWGLEEDEKSNK